MKGNFEYSRSTVMLCGSGIVLSAIFMMVFPYSLLSNADLDTKFGTGFLFLLGLTYFIFCNWFLLMRRKVNITVEDNGVSAFCHIGGALDCSFSQIEDVYCLGNQLTIRLKNGKRYKLFCLENAIFIAKTIRSIIRSDDDEELSEAELSEEFFRLRKKAHRVGLAVGVSVLAMLGSIIAYAAMTGWKEMSDFSMGDWQKFAVMMVVLAAVTVLFIVFLCKYSVCAEIADEAKRKMFKKRFSEIAPFFPFAVAIYVNDEYAPQLRAVVYRSVGENAYFVLEGMNRDFEIEAVGEPVEYASMENLISALSGAGWVKIKELT